MTNENQFDPRFVRAFKQLVEQNQKLQQCIKELVIDPTNKSGGFKGPIR